MYVDSSAERMTTAPTSLGSDLKLYLYDETSMSVSTMLPCLGETRRNIKLTFHL